MLAPGDTFSMNGIVGERTGENGFTEGFIIADGVFKEDLGGGVSQLATTLFNAMFFAGLKDVEHRPHSFYIDRYPVGREATVVWGALDLRFQNDTPYGVLVDTSTTPSTPRQPGVGDGDDVVDEVLGHHLGHLGPVRLHRARDPAAEGGGLRPARGLRRLPGRRHAVLPQGGSRDALDHQEVFHTSTPPRTR